MKKTTKLIALICSLAILAGVFSTIGLAVDADIDYVIISPYADVDWSWKQYKADLHSHTTASDGSDTLKDMIEVNYDYGFDIYAVTDHGTSSRSFVEQEVIEELKFFLDIANPNAPIITLEETGLTFEGLTYNVVTENGDDYYYQILEDGTEGHKMLRVPFGIENNPTSLNNAHVNSWFVDYGHGIVGGTSDYATPIEAVDALGGLSVINHPGEYTNARDEYYTEDAYDSSYSYYIDKFENLLIENPSCLGIDINSKGDSRTRHDRKLWDIMLMDLTPSGRNVYAIATSDAHRVSAAYTGYTRILMPELTSAALQEALANGQFFAASRCLGNHNELAEYAEYLLANGDADAQAWAKDILERQAEDYNAKFEAPYDVDAPMVKSLIVDDDNDIIVLDAEDAYCIRWIANGKTIAWGDTIDLDDYSDEIGTYVRAEILGAGGIVYTQAIMLEYDGAPETENKSQSFDFWWIASIIPDTIVRFLKEIKIFAFLWEELN